MRRWMRSVSGEGARLPRAASDGTYYAYDTSAWLGLALVGTILQRAPSSEPAARAPRMGNPLTARAR